MIRVLAVSALVVLAACAHTATVTSPASPAAHGAVGYVRMDDLVKKHPLFAQLDRYDRDIQALDLTATAPRAAAADSRASAEEAQLERELKNAADRTRRLLDEKQREYQAREQQAIAAALGASAGGGGPTVGSINAQIDSTARNQQADVARRAQHDLDAYRRALQAQDAKELAAAQAAIGARADRALHARSDQLQTRESTLALNAANEDAGERLSLRTKLSSLALDDAARDDAQKKLAALDRREADIVGAQRNRDQAEILSYREALKVQAEKEVADRTAAIRSRSEKQIVARATQLRTQLQTLGAPVVATGPGGGTVAVNPKLTGDVRARVQKLHDDYQRQFQDDAKKTIADFNKTKGDLQKRYDVLHGVERGANTDAQHQIASLQKRRDDLYTQIVSQINREVRVVAQQRGVSVVLTNIAAPAGGVDLTDDAAKDIESLHE